jgi:Flp pilus assembly protein protease CpaA
MILCACAMTPLMKSSLVMCVCMHLITREWLGGFWWNLVCTLCRWIGDHAKLTFYIFKGQFNPVHTLLTFFAFPFSSKLSLLFKISGCNCVYMS